MLKTFTAPSDELQASIPVGGNELSQKYAPELA